MMMPADSWWMALAMGAGVLVLVLALGLVAYACVRAARSPGPGPDALDAGPGSSAELLDRRLAAGEIDAEEYYEREAALRNAAPRAR